MSGHKIFTRGTIIGLIVSVLIIIVGLFYITSQNISDFDMNRVEFEKELFLTDKLTGEEIPDTKIKFGKYVNSSYFCGKVILEEDIEEEAQEECFELIKDRQLAKIFFK